MAAPSDELPDEPSGPVPQVSPGEVPAGGFGRPGAAPEDDPQNAFFDQDQ
jgi:hypothetical protein